MKEEQVAQLLAGHRHLTHGQRRPIKSSAFFFKRRGTGLFQNIVMPAQPPRPHPLHTASCLILFNIQGGGVLSFFHYFCWSQTQLVDSDYFAAFLLY